MVVAEAPEVLCGDPPQGYPLRTGAITKFPAK